MGEPDRTGYEESPDTGDGPVSPGEEQLDGDTGQDSDVTLTTDSEAQHDDSVMRPGNAPD
jgi:hypothetical protein